MQRRDQQIGETSAGRLDLLLLSDSAMTDETSVKISLVAELPGVFCILENTGVVQGADLMVK